MYLLFFLLVPASFIYYEAGCRDRDTIANILALFSGLAAGLVMLLLDSIVLSIIPMDSSSFWLKFTVILLSETCIPYIGGIAILFFVLDAPIKQRISNIRPQLFGIASIFLPYMFFSKYNFPDTWAVLLYPMMILSVLFLADFFIGRFLSSHPGSVDNLDFVISLIPIVVAMILSDAAKSLWFFCFPAWTFMILTLLLIGSSFFFRMLKYRK